ncbi:conserved hypothetical protein [Ricinus communis]|uniref:Uncharacterized protein n=1 Tax=Ricinus communis TaxID=3988 RepID=B9SZP2_RICCO|nr:conserved hypothetical protein [Ricinus communis]
MFIQLFNMAEEEFGLQCNGPLTLPCDAGFRVNEICNFYFLKKMVSTLGFFDEAVVLLVMGWLVGKEMWSFAIDYEC